MQRCFEQLATLDWWRFECKTINKSEIILGICLLLVDFYIYFAALVLFLNYVDICLLGNIAEELVPVY